MQTSIKSLVVSLPNNNIDNLTQAPLNPLPPMSDQFLLTISMQYQEDK